MKDCKLEDMLCWTVDSTLDGPTNYIQWFICPNSLLIGTKPLEAGI